MEMPGEMYLLLEQRGIQVGFFYFFLMADKWFSLFCGRGGRMSVFDWGLSCCSQVLKNAMRTLCVLLRGLPVCCCSNELHKEFPAIPPEIHKSAFRSPLNHLRAWNIGEETRTLPKPPGAIVQLGRPQIDRLIWSPALAAQKAWLITFEIRSPPVVSGHLFEGWTRVCARNKMSTIEYNWEQFWPECSINLELFLSLFIRFIFKVSGRVGPVVSTWNLVWNQPRTRHFFNSFPMRLSMGTIP